MSHDYFARLVVCGTVNGRAAEAQDWQDAMRALSDYHAQCAQHGDEVGQAAAAGLMRAIVLAPKYPRHGTAPRRKLAAIVG